MKRFKLIPVVATAAVGLVLAGGVAVMAQPSDKKPETTQVEKAKPQGDDAKSKRAPGAHGFGGGLGVSADPEQLAAMIDKMPEAMRADVAEVLTADKADRAKLIEAIIAKAKSGEYGDDLAKQIAQGEKMSKQFGQKAKKQWDDLPDSLKKDLEAAKGLDRDKRGEAMKKIMEDAKAGKYGEDVKKKFENSRGFGGKNHFGKKAESSQAS